MAIEDEISQAIADIGNAILRFPRTTERRALIEQLGETYRVLEEKFESKQ